MKPHTTHHDDCGCLSEKHRAEIDALRARVAELEQEYGIYRRTLRDLHALCGHEGEPTTHGLDYTTVLGARLRKHGDAALALAASQAEARDLREALTQLIPEATRGRSCAHTWNAPCAACRASALLSRPHGDDTALREMLTEAVAVAKLEGMKGQQYVTGGYGVSESDLCSDESIVNRILGQPGDDAAPTKEDQMPESREMTLTEKQVVDLAAVVFGKSVEKDPVIEDIFTYHAPEGDQAARYQLIREAAKQFAYTIHCLCEPGPDRTTAIRKVREAAMTANQSIATRNAQYR